MIKKINIIGVITHETTEMVKENLKEFEPDMDKIEKIYIYIDSEGGSVEDMQQILDLLTPYQEKLVTVALRACKSCATFIFLLGNERFIIKECEFLMHRPAYAPQEFAGEFDRITLPLLLSRVKTLKKDEAFMKKFYKEHYVPNDLIKKIFYETNNIIVSNKALLETKMATGICEIEFAITPIKNEKGDLL